MEETREWEGARDRKEGRKEGRLRGRVRGLSPMCLPPTCQSEGSVGVDTTFRV